MNLIDINHGDWVRLKRHDATVSLDRCPGPHGAGAIIHTSDAGAFVFDHLDVTAADGPEFVYRWVTRLSDATWAEPGPASSMLGVLRKTRER